MVGTGTGAESYGVQGFSRFKGFRGSCSVGSGGSHPAVRMGSGGSHGFRRLAWIPAARMGSGGSHGFRRLAVRTVSMGSDGCVSVTPLRVALRKPLNRDEPPEPTEQDPLNPLNPLKLNLPEWLSFNGSPRPYPARRRSAPGQRIRSLPGAQTYRRRQGWRGAIAVSAHRRCRPGRQRR